MNSTTRFIAVVVSVLGALAPFGAFAQRPSIAALQTQITTLQGQVTSGTIPNVGGYVTMDLSTPTRPVLRVSGANLQVVNGNGITASLNGTGNIIVGYDETDATLQAICSQGQYTDQFSCISGGGGWSAGQKTGSHNLIVGTGNRYPRYGALVAGSSNTVNGNYTSITSGYHNTAWGDHAHVSGGQQNTASGPYSAVSGGALNTASGSDSSSVNGGIQNTASGPYSTVTSGYGNNASEYYSSISGATNSTASGFYSSVSGGNNNHATEYWSSVSGGQNNIASGFYSSVGGGANRTQPNNSYFTGGSVTGTP